MTTYRLVSALSTRVLRVAIYARVSSQRQAKEHTISSQLDALNRHIASDGLECDQELCFVDDGFSGSSLIRPGLERLRDQMTPFHGEKGTTWEGGMRIPMMVRWPGVVKPGTVYNDIISLIDWLPTLCAAAGVPDIKEQMASEKGFDAGGGKTFRVRLVGRIESERWYWHGRQTVPATRPQVSRCCGRPAVKDARGPATRAQH
jgi:hypothetical protein